ncbi:MAG: helix-turn-helix transcriptional regulator [Clostridia bacterium]|nr:helix-turn-helix transcriptional regulator [Clostridia bacterium]
MRNRSNNNLPAFYTYHNDMMLDANKPLLANLDINEFTYLHFHDCFEIGYCVSGSGVCRVEDQEYTFKEGDVEIIFPFQKHMSRNDDAGPSYWYWITFNLHALSERSGFGSSAKLEQLIANEMGLCGILTPEEHPEIAELVKKIFTETLEKDAATPYHAELRALYVYQLLIQLSRRSAPLPKLQIQRDRNLQSVSYALDLIAQGIQYGDTPSVESLARASNMSVSNFRKVFRKVTGLSPKDYITQGLLNKAQQLLLTTQKSISEICIETGFGDQSWFNRQFLAKTKMTPSAFRKKFQKEAIALL